MDADESDFVWDSEKERLNIMKHGVDFRMAMEAFRDPKRNIFIDGSHGAAEQRFFCIGKVGEKILTIRFTYREGKIRIFGAGEWRKGRKDYEEDKQDQG